MAQEIRIARIQSTDTIVKSNALVEAQYKLTTMEQRILLTTISQIQKEDTGLNTYRISVSSLCEKFGLNKSGKTFQNIKNSIEKLKSRSVYIKQDEDSFKSFKWVSSAQYEPGQGCITIKLNIELKPLLAEVKKDRAFYQLGKILDLKNRYSFRIYELLKRNIEFTKKEIYYSVDDLKEMFGIKKSQYKQLGHFMTRVIIPIQQELAEKTDIRFEYKYVKLWAKVIGLTFHILKNPKQLN